MTTLLPHWQPLFAVTLLLATALITGGLGIIAMRQAQTPNQSSYVWAIVLLCGSISWWSLTYVLELASGDETLMIMWGKLQYLGIVTLPLAWFVFSFQLTEWRRQLTKVNVAVLGIVPAITILLVMSNEAHGWIWSDISFTQQPVISAMDVTYGWWFWLHSAYSYILLAMGTLLLLRAFLTQHAIYRWQVLVLTIGVLVPTAGSLIHVFRLSPFPVIDITPLTFGISAVILWWSIFRLQLLNLVPVARRLAVRSMRDGFLVTDLQNQIVDINAAALKILSLPAQENVIGLPLAEKVPGLFATLQNLNWPTQPKQEFQLERDGSTHWYEVEMTTIQASKDRLTGYLYILHDITSRKDAERELTSQKALFESLVEVARATAKDPGLDNVLANAVKVARTLTEAELGSLLLLDDSLRVQHRFLSRLNADAVQEGALNMIVDQGLAGWVVRNCEAALVNDTQSDERWLSLPDDSNEPRSVLSVPIVNRDQMLGVLTLQHSAPNYFNDNQLQLMISAADQITLSVQNAQVYEAQRRSAERQSALYEIMRTVSGIYDRELMLSKAAEVIQRLTNWPSVAIHILDETEQFLTTLAATGSFASRYRQQRPVSTTGLAEEALITGLTRFEYKSLSRRTVTTRSLSRRMAVPLGAGSRYLGVLEIYGENVVLLDSDDVWLAESIGESLALALDSSRVHHELKQYGSDLSALYTVTRVASRSLVMSDILEQALQTIQVALGYQSGLITLVDSSQRILTAGASNNLPLAVGDLVYGPGIDYSLCSYVYETARPVQVQDIRDVNNSQPELLQAIPNVRQTFEDMGMRSYTGIPLIHQGECLGTLCLFSATPKRPTFEQIALQRTIGQQLAGAIANGQLFQSVADERGRLKAIIESSRDGIALVSLDQRLLVVNRMALELMNLSGEPSDWTGESMSHVLGSIGAETEIARMAHSEMQRIRRGDEPSQSGEFQVHDRIVGWRNIPVLVDALPVGRLLLLQDFTESRALQQLRDDFTNMMVHDLRNPLGAITASVEFVLDMANDIPPNSPTERFLKTAHNGALRMTRLVDDILDINRFESGQLPVNHSTVDLPLLVDGVVTAQMPQIKAKRIDLVTKISKDVPAAWADANLVERVIHNLIGNAVKFTPSGGRIKIVVNPHPEERDKKINIQVIDSGHGIPRELWTRIFDKFATGKARQSGSGLGLAFCRMAIEAHGEHIHVLESSKTGTIFSFDLPTEQHIRHSSSLNVMTEHVDSDSGPLYS